MYLESLLFPLAVQISVDLNWWEKCLSHLPEKFNGLWLHSQNSYHSSSCQEIACYYGTRRFSIVITKASNLSLF